MAGGVCSPAGRSMGEDDGDDSVDDTTLRFRGSSASAVVGDGDGESLGPGDTEGDTEGDEKGGLGDAGGTGGCLIEVRSADTVAATAAGGGGEGAEGVIDVLFEEGRASACFSFSSLEAWAWALATAAEARSSLEKGAE